MKNFLYKDKSLQQEALRGNVPRPTDLLGIDRNIKKKHNLDELEQDLLNKKKQLSDFDQSFQERQFNIGEGQVSMSKINRRKSSDQALAAIQRNSLTRDYGNALNLYTHKNEQVQREKALRNQEVQEVKKLQYAYPGAGIDFADTTEERVKKIYDFTERTKKMEKEAHDLEVYRNAYAQIKGYMPSMDKDITALQKSIKKAKKKQDKRIKKQAKEAVEREDERREQAYAHNIEQMQFRNKLNAQSKSYKNNYTINKAEMSDEKSPSLEELPKKPSYLSKLFTGIGSAAGTVTSAIKNYFKF